MEYLLIDGYNIIYDWEELEKVAKINLEDARWKLLEILSDYQGYTKICVIVVFDAHLVKGSSEKIEQYENIEIVFTKENETADNYIERLVHNIAKKYIVKVATSDYLEQTIILSKGAYRISANELYKEVMIVRNKNKGQGNIKRHKKYTLETRIDNKTLKILEKLRREKF